MRYITIILLLISLGFGQAVQDILLKEVNVKGNTTTNADLIRYTAGLRAGNTLKTGDFARGVKQLWSMQLFDDVQIYLDEETREGISITIKVIESPMLGKTHFRGNKKISTEKLKEDLSLFPGQRISPNLITKLEKKIKQLYADDGYLKASVSIGLSDIDTTATLLTGGTRLTKDVTFTIDEGKRVKIDRITFSGNEKYSDWRLRRKLKETKQQRWYLFWRSTFDENKYETDKHALLAFYRNHGYRDASIVMDTISYAADKKHMNIHVTVSEGNQYRHRDFSWEGNTLFEDDELRAALDISSGTIFSEEQFNKAIYDRVQGLYMDRGYIYSNITPNITPVGEDSLDVHFTIVENHKVYVRNILISGNDVTRENVIRRELTVFPGDEFNRQRLIRSQQDIWLLNYFANVVPDVIPVDEDEVDLEIVVEERSSGQASMNIGFTQEYGITGGGSLTLNNFRGLGQRFMISLSTGTNYSLYTSVKPTKYHSFSLSFSDPMINDTPNLVGFSLFYTFQGASTQYYYPLDITVRGGSVRWGRRLRWPDNLFRSSWSLQVTQKNYDGEEEDLDAYVGGLVKTVGVKLSQVISRDSRDRPEFPTRGSRFTWTTSISGGFLGGNEDFHKHVLNLEWYTPTFSKFVLMSSLKLGAIAELPSKGDEISIIPLDEKFIMGGNGIPYGNALRGYPDNSVGPQTSRGSPTGGNTMLKFSTEFRFPFSQNPVIYGLLFADMGNVWKSHNLLEPFHLDRNGSFELKRSIGAGIRFFMPMVGMLGFDIGYGFDDILGTGEPAGWNTTITFGQQF
jgi:outer membrane protein insertion porin family